MPIVLAVVAGGLALAGILHPSAVWRLSSDELASAAYARGSLPLFELALRRDRVSPYRWCDYGEALLASGDEAGARRAMSRAAELGPAVGPILMREVNFARRVGDAPGALRYGSRLLALTGEYDDAVFTAWQRMGLAILPALPDRRAARAYLLYAAPAREAWSWLHAKGYIDDKLADDYARVLLDRHEYAAAWAAAGETAGGVFDWRTVPVPGVTVARDGAALRIRFDGTANVGECGAGRLVVLEPGRYHFEARMRTQGITTDEGVGLRVLDATTASLSGDHDWTVLSTQVEVSGAARLAEIRVVRTPSLKFDNKVAGTVWIDGVVLSRTIGRTQGRRRAG